MGISKLRIKQLLGKMSLSRAVLATIALVVLVQGEGSKDDFSPEMMFTQQGFSYERYSYAETAADFYGDYDASLKGQDGLAKKLASAHEEEQTARRKDDGLDGEFVLSSVGIEGGAKAPEDPTSDDFGEMSLVQVMGDDSSWTPSGQSFSPTPSTGPRRRPTRKSFSKMGLKVTTFSPPMACRITRARTPTMTLPTLVI